MRLTSLLELMEPCDYVIRLSEKSPRARPPKTPADNRTTITIASLRLIPSGTYTNFMTDSNRGVHVSGQFGGWLETVIIIPLRVRVHK